MLPIYLKFQQEINNNNSFIKKITLTIKRFNFVLFFFYFYNRCYNIFILYNLYYICRLCICLNKL